LLRQNRPGRRDTSNTKHREDEGFPKVHTQLASLKGPGHKLGVKWAWEDAGRGAARCLVTG
jgi:hypothetical protein